MFDPIIVDEINSTPFKAFLTITGGGVSFLSVFMSIPGASKTIIGAYIPYDGALTDKFLGKKPDNYTGKQTARKLATKSWEECLKGSVDLEKAIGIGATCSLATNDERVGRSRRINICVHQVCCSKEYELILDQSRSRGQEEVIAARLILTALCDTCGVYRGGSIHSDMGKEEKSFSNFRIIPSLTSILEKSSSLKFLNGSPEPTGDLIIYPGSFDPYTKAHDEIRNLSKEILGKEAVLEISVKNADKPGLSHLCLGDRLDSIGDKPAILTNAPLFLDKIKIIKEAGLAKNSLIFICGKDTWERLGDGRYYTYDQMDQFYDKCCESNVQFLVFGRGDEKIQKSFLDMFRIKSEKAASYSNPISSSQIRQESLKKA